MAYCTPEDIRLLIPLIDTEIMDDSEMIKFISKAESYVDSKLRDTYVVPISPVPEIIKHVTAEYTGYLVLRTVYFQNSPNMTEVTKELKDSADQILTGLANGELNLDSETPPSPDISQTYEEKIFSLKDITPYKRTWT
jgi:phage gp36-like protein